MTSLGKIAHLALVSCLSMGSIGLAQGQQRKYTNAYVPTFTPPASQSTPQWRQQSYNNVQQEARQNLGENRPNATLLRPPNETPATRHEMTHNSRPNSFHVSTDYFVGHFGKSNGFHFNGWGPSCPTCGFRQFRGEWYFDLNGGTFGVVGHIPSNWALATDYLYIDVGDDGNYYLYDAQFPNFAVQLTFVQNIGDDQSGDDGQD